VFPDLFFGDVGFQKFMTRMGFLGFFEQLLTDIQAGVLDILGKTEEKPAVAATNVQNGRTRLDFREKWFEIRPDVLTGGRELWTDVVVGLSDGLDVLLGGHKGILAVCAVQYGGTLN
jgi:hypothetical protein